MKTFHNQSLKPYNTFGIEVYSDEFIIPETKEEVVDFAQNWGERNGKGAQPVAPTHQNVSPTKKLLVLGEGSNVLFTGDFHGTVLKIGTRGVQVIQEDEDELIVEAAAGEEWDDFVGHCVERGWYGLENLSGIPGNMGSSPIQNIGAYGAELQEYIHYVEYLDIGTCQILRLRASDCRFGYRDSIFKRDLKGRVIILSVAFRLSKKLKPVLSYQALAQKFEGIPGEDITAAAIREAVIQIRNSKLPDPKVIGNAGSFFKNPVVDEATLDELKRKFPGIVFFLNQTRGQGDKGTGRQGEKETRGQGEWENKRGTRNPEPGTSYKLAAGWLIEQCGWKGYRDRDAGVHRNQALVIVNYGNATGKQIYELSEKIRSSVLERFGVALEREVNVI